MLGCDESVTLIKCDDETYTFTTFEGVSWHDKTQIKVEGTGLVFANAVKIRIPAASVMPDGPLPEVGDHVVKGGLPEGATIDRLADLAPFSPRKVMAVGDNRRGGLPHLVVIGQ